MSQSSRHARGSRQALGADLEPLSRRALQAAGVLSLLLILVVFNSLLNGGGESPFNPNPVAAAAERTQQIPGMRFSMAMRVETESAPPALITGKGAYNGEANLTSVSYRANTSQGAPLKFDAVLGEDGWFFRYPQYADKLPEGKEWLKLQGLPGQSDASKVGESPGNSLQMLAGAGSVQRAGRERIGRVETSRYRATLTPEGVVEALRAQGKDELADQFEAVTVVGPIQAEVFIDGNGMLRRMHTRTSLVTDGKAVTEEVRFDLFDLGIHPDIRVPDDSQVYDLTPLLEEQLEALGEPS